MLPGSGLRRSFVRKHGCRATKEHVRGSVTLASDVRWVISLHVPPRGVIVPNVAEIIKDHVTLEVRCIDRLYLNA